MAHGFQIRDAAGNVTLEITDRISRILGEVDTGGANGSVTDADFAIGTPFYFSYPMIDINTNVGAQIIAPIVSVSGTTLTWSYPPVSHNEDCRIVYGVY